MRRIRTRLRRLDWGVSCYIGYTPSDCAEICRSLEDIGCCGDALLEACGHLSKDCAGRGLTYSNVRLRESVVAVGRSADCADMVNTAGHELLHVVAHVCGEDGIGMQGEEPCYMMGELCENLFESIR